jgi:tetratricopeptide (TPR) repeat protein
MLTRTSSRRPSSAPAPRSDSQVAVEAPLSRYVVQGLLGGGGMSSVYRVLDTARDQVVAMKRLYPLSPQDVPGELEEPLAPELDLALEVHASAGEPTADRRRELRAHKLALFQQEYRVLAELAHPRIIQVHDYGVDSAGPYYTMELLGGSDVANLAPMRWLEVSAVLRDVASALTLIHSRQLLHRDVSPGNVQLDEHGSAKLIDFGALSPIGRPRMVVGTPAFMAPEALLGHALDARSDLYSLGALGYYLLTRRTVHGGQSAADQRKSMHARPTPVSSFAPEVPRALDALLLQLLSPELAARPSSASEVMERLSALAGFEKRPRLSVANAYLAMPALVGRKADLVRVRRRALRTLGSHGDCLIVVGEPGTGRSRFLDACCLEGKLAGLTVLRGEASDALSNYGVLRALVRQLHATLGATERAQTALSSEVQQLLSLGIAWTEPSGSTRPSSPAVRGSLANNTNAAASQPRALERAKVHEALTRYLTVFSRKRPLLIAIDDFERIDEPSASLLVSLAQNARDERILLIASAQTAGRDGIGDAERVLRRHAREIVLTAMSLPDTAALLRSMFGDVPNVSLVASRVHALSSGNARTTVELVQHLLDTGVVSYANGGFELPDALSADELPQNQAEALRARALRLSAPARELASIVSLADGARLSVRECLDLLEPGDAERGERALAELLNAQLVQVHEDVVALRQPALTAVLARELSKERAAVLRTKLAQCLAKSPDRLLRSAEQYFEAGLPARAVDMLLAGVAAGAVDSSHVQSPQSLLERGVRACEELGRSKRDAFALRKAISRLVLPFLEPCDRAPLLALARELYELAGLADWDAMHDEPLPERRLERALERARERYQQTPTHDRVLSPDAALGELVSYLLVLVGYASSALDLELLERIPSLAAFAVRSPLVAIVDELASGLRDLRAGRNPGYLASMQRILARLAAPDRAGLSSGDARRLRANFLYGLGLTAAAWGDVRAFVHADELDLVPSQRLNAWRIRQIANLFRCAPREAEACRREVERLKIAHGARQFHHGATLETEFWGSVRADDLLGLRRLLPDLVKMGKRHPGWRPAALAARAELERVRGRLELALPLYEQAMAVLPLQYNVWWAHAGGGYVDALVELGRAHEGKARGLAWIAACDEAGIEMLRQPLIMSVARAEAALGQVTAAIARVTPLLDLGHSGGMLVGLVHELRARLAIDAGCPADFRSSFALAQRHLGYGEHPSLTARLDRLRDLSRKAGFRDPGQLESPDELARQTVKTALAKCSEPRERAGVILGLLREASGARAGHLYAVQSGVVRHLATHDLPEPGAALAQLVAKRLAMVDTLDHDTVTLENTTESLDVIELSGQRYEIMTLLVDACRQPVVVGAAALVFDTSARDWPSLQLLEALAEEMRVR